MSVELKFPITKSQYAIIIRSNDEVDKLKMALSFAEKARDANLSAILAADEELFKQKIAIKSFAEGFISYVIEKDPEPEAPQEDKKD